MSCNGKQSYLQHNKYNTMLIQRLFTILAPHECLQCSKEGSLLCYDCQLGLPQVPIRCYKCGRWNDNSRTCAACRRRTSIHTLWAVTLYKGAAKDLVARLKFNRASAAADLIAEMVAAQCKPGDGWIVTYVPTASERMRMRGYDQSALIAKRVARLLGCPFVPCLARTGQQRQVGQTRAVRTQQMATAFRPIRPQIFQNQRVLVIDDVLTTGATCEAAAQTLRAAGAKQVSAAVFAVA
jgi:ComF family protein